ncbi:MAG: CoA pyrophosphatase [Desulfuromonadales bacterium]|nr:CoA pyrophosphatase [Desulfuromonadales bacterium]
MNSLQQVTEQLARYPAKPMVQGELRSAAVLVPLFLRHDRPWILFTRRTEQLKKHSGEISFPGGGAEEQDADFWQTALRETEEEMGIRAADVRRLGQLDDFYSIHGYRVKVCVGSYVDPYPYRVDENEIAEVIELPLERLCDPQIYHQEDWQHKGRLLPVDFYQLDGHNIWGMTAGILKQLLQCLEPIFTAGQAAVDPGRPAHLEQTIHHSRRYGDSR